MNNLLSIVAIALIAFGGSALYGHLAATPETLAASSETWPSADGLITFAELAARRHRISTGEKTRFDLQVRYEYIVDERVYRNDIVRFDQGLLSNTGKRRLVSEYPVGRRVAVYFDPDHPATSVLVPGSYPEGG